MKIKIIPTGRDSILTNYPENNIKIRPNKGIIAEADSRLGEIAPMQQPRLMDT